MNSQRAALAALLVAVFMGCATQGDPLSTKDSTKPLTSCVEASDEGPASIVRALYRDYPFDGPKAIPNEAAEVIAWYFDAPLTALFVKDQQCVQREEGVCNLDFDILLNAQDYQLSDFRMCAPQPGSDVVEVRFVNFGRPETIGFVVRQVAAGWRISDVRYSNGATLVSILSHEL